ncbi:hypothetical protein [Saccharopolyspora griseoalba]|uniref:Uncharacterized protein n=1 Tax=Saccharopolyspora griseoalba TaxID=1431848 RepID=A0ABW2LEF1_9PSEU
MGMLEFETAEGHMDAQDALFLHIHRMTALSNSDLGARTDEARAPVRSGLRLAIQDAEQLLQRIEEEQLLHEPPARTSTRRLAREAASRTGE